MKPDDLINFVCKSLELDRDKLLSDLRSSDYADGRFIIAKILKDEGLTFKAIATILNKRGHATALYCDWKAGELIKTDKKFKEKYLKVLGLVPSNPVKLPACKTRQ